MERGVTAAILCLALALGGVAGCRRGHKRTTETPAPSATDADLQAAARELDAAVAAALAARRKQTCPHPATPAAPSDDSLFVRALTSLVEPSGALAECALAVERAKAELKAALSDCPPGGTGPCPARALDDAASRTAAIASIELACGALPGALGAAARPASDVCSPYLPGRRRAPDPTSFLFLSRAATVLARTLGRDQQPARALELLVDTLAAGQELTRGGVGLSLALAATGAVGFLAPTAELILNTQAPPRAALDALAARLDALIGGEPPLAEQLAADALETQSLLAASAGAASADDTIARLAADAQARAAAARCPAAATLAACVRALAEPGVPPEALAAYPLGLRAALTDHLAGELTPPAAGYARKYGLRLAMLAALRAHVELLRTPRGCADEVAWDQEPLRSLLAPAALGAPITVTPVGPGSFELHAPGFLSDDGKPRQIGRIDSGCSKSG